MLMLGSIPALTLFCFNLDKVSDFRLQVYKMGWTDSVFDSDIVMATIPVPEPKVVEKRKEKSLSLLSLI